MSIETIRTFAPDGGQLGSIGKLEDTGAGEAPGAVARSNGPSFAETLSQALGGVERTQTEADDQAARVAMGGGNLHEMSLALEKADISMRLATKVRNKLL